MTDDLHIRPTPEQELIRSTVRRYVESDYAQEALKESGETEPWQTFANMGWLAASLPEALGGFGEGIGTTALIAQELGRGLVPEPFVSFVGSGAAFLVGVPGDTAAGLLREFSQGNIRVALAHDESGRSAHDGDTKTIACASAQGWIVNGEKKSILGGPEADTFLVTARLDRGDGEFGVLAVPRNAEGLVHDQYETIDCRQAANITLSNINLPLSSLLARGTVARRALTAALDQTLVLASAEMLGAMEYAFELTRTYLNTRRQFGQLIGEFQALRHRLADMYIELEQARSMVLLGVKALENRTRLPTTMVASAVKARVAEAARYVAGQAVQLHGGIGMTTEYPVGPIFRKAVAFDLWLGTASEHVNRFATLTERSE